jgi:hypothetical protein
MTRDGVIRMAREQGLPETEIEGVFVVNTDDLGRLIAAERVAAGHPVQRFGTQEREPTMQDVLMKFDPATGEERPYPSHATQWRNWHGIAAWLFDPWTGKRRNAYDVSSDVHGLLIAPTGTLGMDMGGGSAEKNNVAGGLVGSADGIKAQPAPSTPEVTDAMAIAFHSALTDGSIGLSPRSKNSRRACAQRSQPPRRPSHD